MDGATSPRDYFASAITRTKKKPPAVLEEVARDDPQRAKRIMTNRRSAMKAKQRKKMYVHSLEHNVQRLYCEAAALSARLALWQTDAFYIDAENKRMKEFLNHIVQQIQWQDSLMDETKKEIQNLKRMVWSHKISKNILNAKIDLNSQE